jgi:ABC-type transport system involved in multi-copper enzyme maturation permease subunit
MAMVIGDMMYEVTMIFTLVLEEVMDLNFTTQLSVSNLNKLFYLDKFRLQYINGEDVTVYETALEAELIAGTIGVSLIVAIACLGLGYLYFKKSDMN